VSKVFNIIVTIRQHRLIEGVITLGIVLSLDVGLVLAEVLADLVLGSVAAVRGDEATLPQALGRSIAVNAATHLAEIHLREVWNNRWVGHQVITVRDVMCVLYICL
jgi:hypothetical protein